MSKPDLSFMDDLVEEYAPEQRVEGEFTVQDFVNRTKEKKGIDVLPRRALTQLDRAVREGRLTARKIVIDGHTTKVFKPVEAKGNE